MASVRSEITCYGASDNYRSVLTITSAGIAGIDGPVRSVIDITSGEDSMMTVLTFSNSALELSCMSYSSLERSTLLFSKFFNTHFAASDIWKMLADPTAEQINISHLTNAATYIQNHIHWGSILDKPSWVDNYPATLADIYSKISVAAQSGGDEFGKYFEIDSNNNIKVKGGRGFYSNSFISAYGLNSDNGAGNGLSNIYKFSNLGDTFEINGVDTFNAYAINEIWKELQNTKQSISSSAAGLFKVDSNGNVYLEDNAGLPRGFYTKNGFMAANGVSGEDEGESGAGKITNVYKYTDFGQNFDALSEADTFNAHAIKSIYTVAQSWLTSPAHSITAAHLTALNNLRDSFDNYLLKATWLSSAASGITPLQVSTWDKITALFDIDDSGNVYVKDSRGFYSNSFVSAKDVNPDDPETAGSNVVWNQLYDDVRNRVQIANITIGGQTIPVYAPQGSISSDDGSGSTESNPNASLVRITANGTEYSMQFYDGVIESYGISNFLSTSGISKSSVTKIQIGSACTNIGNMAFGDGWGSQSLQLVFYSTTPPSIVGYLYNLPQNGTVYSPEGTRSAYLSLMSSTGLSDIGYTYGGTVTESSSSGSGSGSSSGVSRLSELVDVYVGSPSVGDVLYWTGSRWVNEPLSNHIGSGGTSTAVSIPLASAGTRGGIKVGFDEYGKSLAVKLANEMAYVTLPSLYIGSTEVQMSPGSQSLSGLVDVSMTGILRIGNAKLSYSNGVLQLQGNDGNVVSFHASGEISAGS